MPGDQPRQSRSEAALLQWVSPVLRIRMQDGGSAAKPINSHTGADARMTGGGAARVPGPGMMGYGLATFTRPAAG